MHTKHANARRMKTKGPVELLARGFCEGQDHIWFKTNTFLEDTEMLKIG